MSFIVHTHPFQKKLYINSKNLTKGIEDMFSDFNETWRNVLTTFLFICFTWEMENQNFKPINNEIQKYFLRQ